MDGIDMSPSGAEPLAEIRDLSVRFVSREATVHAVNGVSFTVRARRGAVHPRRVAAPGKA